MSIKVAGRSIGNDNTCFIIAEAGSNHDRKLDQALRLIEVAAEAGADAVKFQTFSADRIAARTTSAAVNLDGDDFRPYGETLHELYKKAEMPDEWHERLMEYAQSHNLFFLSTPFDEVAVDRLDDLGVKAFKIASFEIVHLPLLKHVAGKGKPVIISTGMAPISDIEEAVNVVEGEGNNQIILLHCGIGYPPKMEDIHLAAMDSMKATFPEYPIGYSDHTLGITVPTAAVARGAKVIEKHFTVDKDLDGPDHRFALDPDELKQMVQAIRDTEEAIGNARKATAPGERVYHRRGRRSLFASQDIAMGTSISTEMISVLSPGIGLHSRYLPIIVGRKAQRDIRASEPITWEDI